jgi:hypothetical protein
MDISLEEFSPAKLKEMSDQEVYDRMAYLQEQEEAIKSEQVKCRDRLGIKPKRAIPEKCASCGSTNIEARAKGGYFCKSCGFRANGSL